LDRSGYRFSKTHEWVSGSSGLVRIGITEYAQSQLGDVIYVELPQPGGEIAAGAKFGVIESVKAASDLYSPAGGAVKEANAELAKSPELINNDPYDGGWMLQLELNGELSPDLLDEAGYKEFVEGL
jgi:glycine cleavage system H protein